MTIRHFLLAAALTAPAQAQVAGLAGTLVVTNKGPSTATIIDVGSGRTLATLPTGNGPHEVVLSSDGRWAVVTDYSGQPGKTLTVIDRKSTRLNSSHSQISYAVFCLKKKIIITSLSSPLSFFIEIARL